MNLNDYKLDIGISSVEENRITITIRFDKDRNKVNDKNICLLKVIKYTGTQSTGKQIRTAYRILGISLGTNNTNTLYDYISSKTKLRERLLFLLHNYDYSRIEENTANEYKLKGTTVVKTRQGKTAVYNWKNEFLYMP